MLLRSWHVGPVQKPAQTQLVPVPTGWHVPPFRQGSGIHTSTKWIAHVEMTQSANSINLKIFSTRTVCAVSSIETSRTIASESIDSGSGASSSVQTRTRWAWLYNCIQLAALCFLRELLRSLFMKTIFSYGLCILLRRILQHKYKCVRSARLDCKLRHWSTHRPSMGLERRIGTCKNCNSRESVLHALETFLLPFSHRSPKIPGGQAHVLDVALVAVQVAPLRQVSTVQGSTASQFTINNVK